MNPRHSLKEHAAAILLPLLLSLATIISRFHVVGLTMDGVTYLQISRNILHGKGMDWQALWVTPLHSILIAAVSFLSGIEDLLVAATIVSVMMGFLLVFAVYFTAYQLFDRKTALISATIAAISPHLLKISFSDEAEITYTFFLTLSLALITLALKRDAWIYSALAGASFALAYLARSEGFLVMVLVLSTIALLQGRNLFRSRILAKCIVVTVLFVIISSPYLLFLKKHYGTWVISPKASYVMTWMKCFTYHDNAKGEEGNAELWGLSEKGKLRWQEPQGIGDLISFLGSHPQKSISVYLRNLSHEIPGRIPNGSGMENFPQLFPVYLAMFAFFSIFLKWGSLAKEKKGVLVAPLAILLVLPVFTDGWWKYLVPYLPIVIILASKGFIEGVRLFLTTIRYRDLRYAENVLLLVGVLGVGLHFLPSLSPQPQPAPLNSRQSLKNEIRAEAKKAGEYGFRLLGPGNNYMISWSPLIYYLNGFWTARPVTSAAGQIAYARRNHVDYFVFDIQDPKITTDVMLALDPELQLVGLYVSENTPFKVGFYRILPKRP